MSTVAEIREAIDQLNDQDRCLLLTELFATMAEPDDNEPELQAALARGIADCEAGRIYSLEEVEAKLTEWTTPWPSPRRLGA